VQPQRAEIPGKPNNHSICRGGVAPAKGAKGANLGLFAIIINEAGSGILLIAKGPQFAPNAPGGTWLETSAHGLFIAP